MPKKYVDIYDDMDKRVDVYCPYCGSLHAVFTGVLFFDSWSWGCRNCNSIFDIPLMAKIPVIKRVFKWTGKKLK